jgi:Arc/MetJ-type ribon-helix-helix transcriptional regulator
MTVKITVSLPDELVEHARVAVEQERAASVSAYVAEALRAYESRYTLDTFLDEMDAELGAPGPEAEAWARSVLWPELP